MKSQEALPVAPTIPDPMTKNDSPPPLEPIASRDVTLEAKPAAPDVVEPERSAQPKIKDLADRKQFKRMRPVPSTDELLAQLLKAREMDLEKKFNGPTARSLLAYAKSHRNEKPQPSREIFSRNDLVGMPVLKGDACRLGKESTEALNKLSSQLRPIMADSASSSFRDVGSSLRERLETSSSRLWETPEAVPGLVQMLQVEDRPTRLLLVDMLARIECRESTRALARRAMFDVSENVREAAVNALRRRPAEDSREVLLEGLRYPWPAAACFAAEALVNLEDTGAVPHLVRLLDEADPAGPCAVMSGSSATHQIREIVRINHLRNCMLCHPPSLASNDPVRAAVPDPTQPLSGTYSPQSASLGLFVRADVTYLKQDFSVQQPVVNPGVMPAHQRYDYFVRARIVSAPSATARPQAALYPQKQAVLFALCELTGEDYGDTTAGWLECLDSAARTERDRDTRAAENPY